MTRPTRRGYRWTDAEDAAVRAGVACGDTDSIIADRLGRTTSGVSARVYKMRCQRPKSNRHHPPKAVWIALATAEAEKANVSPIDVMAGVRTLYVPRWRAWAKAKELGYSLAGIGIVSGFHHTTIMHGIERLLG